MKSSMTAEQELPAQPGALGGRPGAGTTPVALMELTTGFWRFKVLAAGVELGLFTLLDRLGEADAARIGAELGLNARPVRMLLACCTSLDLLEREPDGHGAARYRNAPVAAEFLVEERPHYFGGFVRYSDRYGYPGWARLTEALRTDRPTTWDPDAQESAFVTADPAILEGFWGAMFTLSSFTAAALGEAYDFTRHRRLLDVGGGAGAFPVSLCRRHPHLRATVLDLPRVAAMARAKAAELGLSESIEAAEGDFLRDPELPAGHDVILLSMILHDWDEKTGRRLLEKCWAALPSGGAVVICELVLDDDESGPAPAALMGLNMLVETRAGHNWTYAEYADWLTAAGFGPMTVLPLDAAGANAALVARKP
ncbi:MULTISPECIES: acetylserotonin O-methyltransferase [Streptomyces]|uniref:acetylserotonin O-methyltransferase n=1 Tax=Streptomyces TaxID=1883 RepID=UPI000AFE920C|nr:MULTISPECIES: acetylserotonin O-methyltransferase [Streptomyces]